MSNFDFLKTEWADAHSANREDKKPRVLIYFGGANVYYDKLKESAEAGFPELEFKHRVA